MNRKPTIAQVFGALYFLGMVPILYLDAKLFPDKFGRFTLVVMIVYAALVLLLHRFTKSKGAKSAGVLRKR